MKLGDYRLIFIAVGLVGILFIASPAIAGFVPAPGDEAFSEIYLLGPEQMAQGYPSNLAVGQNYSVYVNVGNHLGTSAYYVLYIKLGNSTDQLPNSTLGTPSPLQPLYEYRLSIKENTVWQQVFSFEVTDATISSTTSQINTLQVNDVALNVDKSAVWDSNSTKSTYKLFFELWLFNDSTGSVEFNNRYVNLLLNLT
jgi:uncharacterized membrane protein